MFCMLLGLFCSLAKFYGLLEIYFRMSQHYFPLSPVRDSISYHIFYWQVMQIIKVTFRRQNPEFCHKSFESLHFNLAISKELVTVDSCVGPWVTICFKVVENRLLFEGITVCKFERFINLSASLSYTNEKNGSLYLV